MRWVVLAAAAALQLSPGASAAANLPKPWETLRATAPLPPAVKTGRQKVAGGELHYAIYGRGEPVILLHPALGNGDYWANQVGPLSQEFQVIVVDLRGHGRSTATGGPITYRLMAEDVLRLIKDQRLKQPAIVGWGDGAVVGLELATRYPKRIGKLVMFGAAFDRSGLQPRPDRADTFVDYVHRAQADHARLSGHPEGFMRTLDQFEALWERGPAYSREELAKIRTPTTVMAAEYDEWVKPEHMGEAATLIPGARMIMLPRTSHFAPWQGSKKFNDSLLVALRR